MTLCPLSNYSFTVKLHILKLLIRSPQLPSRNQQNYHQQSCNRKAQGFVNLGQQRCWSCPGSHSKVKPTHLTPGLLTLQQAG